MMQDHFLKIIKNSFSFFTCFSFTLFAIYLQLSLSSCSKKEVQPVKISPVEKVEIIDLDKVKPDENPPASYVEDLIKTSEYILLVRVTDVDSVFQAEKVNHAVVLKSFKGNLKKRVKISYFLMSDMPYIKNPNDTLLIFLDKNKEPSLGLADEKIYFGASENSSFKYTKFIDSLLNKK